MFGRIRQIHEAFARKMNEKDDPKGAWCLQIKKHHGGNEDIGKMGKRIENYAESKTGGDKSGSLCGNKG